VFPLMFVNVVLPHMVVTSRLLASMMAQLSTSAYASQAIVEMGKTNALQLIVAQMALMAVMLRLLAIMTDLASTHANAMRDTVEMAKHVKLSTGVKMAHMAAVQMPNASILAQQQTNAPAISVTVVMAKPAVPSTLAMSMSCHFCQA